MGEIIGGGEGVSGGTRGEGELVGEGNQGRREIGEEGEGQRERGIWGRKKGRKKTFRGSRAFQPSNPGKPYSV